MGVMSCYRNGCGNIMCDTYVSSVGYVCSDCQNEFSVLFPRKYSERKLVKKLMEFMNTEKRYNNHQEYDGDIDAQEFFNKNTN